MIDYKNYPTMAASYRGTVEVFEANPTGSRQKPDWYWHIKGKNGAVTGVSEGYKTRAGCIAAADRELGAMLTGSGLDPARPATVRDLVVPRRLVVRDRDHKIERIGALY
jgi:hypothetical protein